jgi:hypothetical protein
MEEAINKYAKEQNPMPISFHTQAVSQENDVYE